MNDQRIPDRDLKAAFAARAAGATIPELAERISAEAARTKQSRPLVVLPGFASQATTRLAWAAVLTALTVALSMRIVGILLTAALMVLPVIAAGRIAWSLGSTLFLAVAIGLASVLGGLTVAYYADLPPGGVIVLLAAGTFVAASAGRAVRAR